MHASIVQRLFFPHIVDDEFVSAIVAHVVESVRAAALDGNVFKLRRRKAQAIIEKAACKAVAEMWTAAYGKTFTPNRNWPDAKAILLDNPRRCVVELWIGHEYHDNDTPDPIEIFFDDLP